MTEAKLKQLTELLKEMSADYKISIEEYIKDADSGQYNWHFNWIGGGWNDVWEKTREEAIAKVAAEREASEKEYPTHVKLKADPTSFTKHTSASSDRMNRLGNMMTC